MSATLISSFEALDRRDRITAKIVGVTGLRVGAGKAMDPIATDQPIMRDALGRPFLPGSAIKGALRSGLERVLRGVAGTRRHGLWSCDLFIDDIDDGTHRCTAEFEALFKDKPSPPESATVRAALCTTCGLFGSSLFAGRLFVHDAPLVPGSMLRTEIRDGVGINRDLRIAQPKIKYDTETVPPGTAFRLEILLENANDLQRALVLQALHWLNDGLILLGGMTSRGLGRVRLEQPALASTDARRLLAGDGFEPHSWSDVQDQATTTLSNHLAHTAAEEAR